MLNKSDRGVVSLLDPRGRLFVPTEVQGDPAHSRGQDWPQTTAAGGAQRSGRRRARRQVRAGRNDEGHVGFAGGRKCGLELSRHPEEYLVEDLLLLVSWF
jgi:hypothetical protein